MEEIKNHIRRFVNISDKELNAFTKELELQEVKNKEFLLKEGTHSLHHYFVVKGCLRSFFINKKGVEKIVNFAIEDWWISDYDSLINKTPAYLNIQAVEDSIVLKIPQEKLEALFETSTNLNSYFRKILEIVRIADQKRVQFMFNMSGKEMYEHFRDNNPEFMQRVPQYMLASYLGFTPEFLSKVRGLQE